MSYLQDDVVLEGVFDAANHILRLSLRQLHRRRGLEEWAKLCKLRDGRQLLGIPGEGTERLTEGYEIKVKQTGRQIRGVKGKKKRWFIYRKIQRVTLNL